MIGKLGTGFPIQVSWAQNQWVVPKLTQPFILQRSIKWVLETSGDLVVKGKLSSCSSSAALRQLNCIHKKGVIKLGFFIFFLNNWSNFTSYPSWMIYLFLKSGMINFFLLENWCICINYNWFSICAMKDYQNK